MPRPKPWLKLWVDFLNDPKMDRLTLAEQGAWWRLVAEAHICVADGHLQTSSGSPMTMDEIAKALKIVTPEDRAVLQSLIAKMTHEKSITIDHGVLFLKNYVKRQRTAASDAPEAVAARVKAWRAKHKKAQLPLPEGSPSDTPSNKEKEENTNRSDQDKECNAENLVTSLTPEGLNADLTSNGKLVTESGPISVHVTGSGVTSPLHPTPTEDPLLAEISRCHRENFGDLKPLLADDIRDFCEHTPVPVPWVELAFREALGQNKRKWAYVAAILEDWKQKGAPNERYQRQSRAGSGHTPAAARAAIGPVQTGPGEGWEPYKDGDDLTGKKH